MKNSKKSGKSAPEHEFERKNVVDENVYDMVNGKPLQAEKITEEESINSVNHEIERIEVHRSGTMVSKSILEEENHPYINQILNWLESTSRYGNLDSVYQIFDCNIGGDSDSFAKYDPKDFRRFIKVFFWTEANEYVIYFNMPSETYKGYITCGSTCRRKRVGEIHSRGRDIGDGRWERETYDTIVLNILRNELKSIQATRKCDSNNRKAWHN